MRGWFLRLRIHAGYALLGKEFYGVITVLWEIRRRAMVAVKPDGRVDLAECKALADALYTQLPGRWTLTVTCSDTAEGP